MKRISIIGLISLTLLACQSITEITIPTILPTTMPTAESLNTPSILMEETAINSTSSLNSDIVFVIWGDGVYTMDEEGNNKRKLANSLYPSFPKWSPDKKQIAFVHVTDDGYPLVYIMNSDGSDQRPVSTEAIPDTLVYNFEWSPDGKSIAIWGELGFYVINTLDDEIVYQEKMLSGDYYCCASWSPHNREIALGEGVSILIKNVGDGTLKQTINVHGYVDALSWSPDGNKIAFSTAEATSCMDSGVNCSGLFVMNPDGSELLQLGNEVNEVYKVRDWTADGKYILFDTSSYTSLIKVDDSEIIETVKYPTNSILSRDGKYILYMSQGRICKIKIDEPNEICLTESANGPAYPDW